MMTLHIEALIEPVLSLVAQAAQAIRQIDQQREAGPSAAVHLKTDGSPVTQADWAAHRILSEGLSALIPHWPVVSEEDQQSWAHRLPQGLFWLIDPLDGTKEFLNRNGEYTVNVALIENGLPLFGVVGLPASDQYYWGGADLGAWSGRAQGSAQPLSAAAAQSTSALRITVSRSHRDEATERLLARLSLQGPIECLEAGSSLKFCRLATGEADLYPRMGPTCEWDTAAAQAVLEGAGGSVLDPTGQRLRYGKSQVLNPSFLAMRNRIERNAAGLREFIELCAQPQRSA